MTGEYVRFKCLAQRHFGRRLLNPVNYTHTLNPGCMHVSVFETALSHMILEEPSSGIMTRAKAQQVCIHITWDGVPFSLHSDYQNSTFSLHLVSILTGKIL